LIAQLTARAGPVDDVRSISERMVMNEDARAAELIQKMLRKKLYVLISKPLVPPEQLRPLLATHLDYMIGLEKRGLLFASGPLNETAAERTWPDHPARQRRRRGAPHCRGRAVLRARAAHIRAQGVDGDGGHAWCARQSVGSKRRSGVT
jgi:hypothetical protein